MKGIVCLLLLLPIVRSQTELLAFRPNAESFTANAGSERQLECRYYDTEDTSGSLSLFGPAVGSSRTEVSGNGMTRYVLTIRDVEISDAGTYTCYHTGGEQVEVELIVFDDPEFLEVPLEQTLIEGSDAVVQCPVYLGHPPGTLQWFKDNSEITTTPGSRFSVQSDGLHIENVGMQDSGEYLCLLERQGWGAYTREITVDVQPASPCIDKSMHPLVEVLYNQAVSIDCMLMTGCAEADVWWVEPNGVIVREQTLHLETPHIPGIYSCFARNDNGDDKYDVILDVRVPPLPLESERTVSFNEGQTILLAADLDIAPNPVPAHTWRSREGDSVPMQQEPRGGQRVYVTAEGRLMIRDVTVGDSGTYLCTVENQHGTSVQTINLQVAAIPQPPTSVATLTLNIDVEDCDSKKVEELTQQITVELQQLCGCMDISVFDSSLECLSASEAKYSAKVQSQTGDANSLVEQLSSAHEEGKTDVHIGCGSNCPQESGNMLVPVVVTLSVVCVVIVLGAVTATIYCRRSKRSSLVAEVEHGHEVISQMKSQESSATPPYGPYNLESSLPCPFPHPSHPAGPFHQQPLTPPPRSHKSP